MENQLVINTGEILQSFDILIIIKIQMNCIVIWHNSLTSALPMSTTYEAVLNLESMP